jgi:hypothetical protein
VDLAVCLVEAENPWTKLHDVTSQKIAINIFCAVKTVKSHNSSGTGNSIHLLSDYFLPLGPYILITALFPSALNLRVIFLSEWPRKHTGLIA